MFYIVLILLQFLTSLSCQKNTQKNSLGVDLLTDGDILQLARQAGFVQRKVKKISPITFFKTLCTCALEGSPSYNDLAIKVQTEQDIAVSKQAYWKRVNPNCVLFFELLLAKIIQIKMTQEEDSAQKLCGFLYKRILVQDSTIIKLPQSLFDRFSGVSNGHTKVCNARIQGTYDLIAGRFIRFSIDPYYKNDLAAAPELEIQPGDLVLRDRGYSSYQEMQRHSQNQASLILRHKFTNRYYDPETRALIDLKALLIKEGKLDRQVCLNNAERTKVRILAMPVDEQTANIRRMKAKKEMKGHNPPQELLFLMSWTIFVTNITDDQADFEKILAIYRLRWRIEIIFKAWKSHMKFAQIHQVSYCQLMTILNARLIMITLSTHLIYRPYQQIILNRTARHLSMLKLFKLLSANPSQITEAILALQYQGVKLDRILKLFIKHCTYDKRKRTNYGKLMDEFLLS